MCGFAGCLTFPLWGARTDGLLRPAPRPPTEWVAAATRRLTHRGPDDSGCYSDGRIALGFRRLAVLDPTPAGHQPMVSPDGRFVMVFNGEIYNFRELRRFLVHQGVQLRTDTDSEVLLALYLRLGQEAVHHLRGMFAFAVWDTLRAELFCARDPFGIKPFFFRAEGGDLRFASEKKALAGDGRTAPTAPEPVDADQLRRFLAFQFPPGPGTMTPGVHHLPPGHTLTVTGGQLRTAPYWHPKLAGPSPRRQPGAVPGPAGRTARKGDPAARILAALKDAVAVHMRSDVPLGAFLSSGIDSALVCALAAEQRPDIRTFTVGFAREGYNEIDDARHTAEHLGINLSSHIISPRELAADLPRIVWHLDDPLADPSAAALWFLAREARRRVTVVLSGEGADELFGGYGVYRQPWLVRAANRSPGPARSSLARLARLLPETRRGRGLLERMATPLDRRYIGNAHIFTDRQLDAVARQGSALPYDRTAPVYEQARREGLDDITTMQLVDLHTWLPGDILTKADRMTMAHGLELRVPFLDREVYEVSAGLTRHDKLGAGEAKHALREAARMVLPPEVARRPKRGFPVPTGHLLATELADWAHDVLTTASAGDYISPREAARLLREHTRGHHDHGRRLWCLLMFLLWHQIFVEGRYDPAAQGWERDGGSLPAAA